MEQTECSEITQKETYNIYNTAKFWNQECYTYAARGTMRKRQNNKRTARQMQYISHVVRTDWPILTHGQSHYRMLAKLNLYPLPARGVYIHLLTFPCDCESLTGYIDTTVSYWALHQSSFWVYLQTYFWTKVLHNHRMTTSVTMQHSGAITKITKCRNHTTCLY